MWDPISDHNPSSLDPSTANQTNHKNIKSEIVANIEYTNNLLLTNAIGQLWLGHLVNTSQVFFFFFKSILYTQKHKTETTRTNWKLEFKFPTPAQFKSAKNILSFKNVF